MEVPETAISMDVSNRGGEREMDEHGVSGDQKSFLRSCGLRCIHSSFWRLIRIAFIDHFQLFLLWWSVVEFIQKATMAAYVPVPNVHYSVESIQWWDNTKNSTFLGTNSAQWKIPPRELAKNELHFFIAPTLSYCTFLILLWWLVKMLRSPFNLSCTSRADTDNITFTYFIREGGGWGTCMCRCFHNCCSTWCCADLFCKCCGPCCKQGRSIQYKRNALGELYIREWYWANATKMWNVPLTQFNFKWIIALLISIGVWLGHYRANTANKARLLDEIKFPVVSAFVALFLFFPVSPSFYMQQLLEVDDPKYVFDNVIPAEFKDKKIEFSASALFCSTQTILQAAEHECLREWAQRPKQEVALCV